MAQQFTIIVTRLQVVGDDSTGAEEVRAAAQAVAERMRETVHRESGRMPPGLQVTMDGEVVDRDQVRERVRAAPERARANRLAAA